MINVLIFLPRDAILPKGGPSGYVYNLLSGMDDSDEIKLHFLPESNKSNLKKTYSKLPLSIKKIYRFFARNKDYRRLKKKVCDVDEDFIKSFDVVHFHSCFSLYKNLPILKNYTGKVVLTSHSPKPPHLEMIQDVYGKTERFLFGKKHLHVYEKIVEEAFLRANNIIYPCEQAEEPYINNWSKYLELKKEFQKKIKYLPTGAQSCLEKVKISKEEIRSKYNIPKDAFLISFVGRHNEVKGYDTLKNIASLFSEKENVYFIIAGEESPLKRPNLPYWREVGWTNDPYSIINASDLFVLPNKETYFDLVLLETLSIGVKVLLSYTGGNKFFENMSADIFFFNNEKDAVDKINTIKSTATNNFDNNMSLNRTLFVNSFNSKIFANRYISAIKEIVNQ